MTFDIPLYHVDQHGLQGIVTVSYKTYRDTYRNTYQISRYVSLAEKVYRYTPTQVTDKLYHIMLLSRTPRYKQDPNSQV